MGSGTAIIRAIKKYGIHNFRKEIIETFESSDDAFAAEAEIVTESFVKRKDTYNLKCGGVGGWDHINHDLPEHRKNLQALRQKCQSGEIKVGGTKYWTEETWANAKNHGWKARITNGQIDPNKWKGLSPEKRAERVARLSKSMSGNRNGMHGTKFFIDQNHQGPIPSISILNTCHRYIPGSEPNGWISLDQWKDLKKNHKSPAYGRSWYNDGHRNYSLKKLDPTISNLGLKRGRIRG